MLMSRMRRGVLLLLVPWSAGGISSQELSGLPQGEPGSAVREAGQEAPPDAAGEPSAELARALAAVRAEFIRSDLRFIASDELAGRDTPSHGQRVAARFIRARLQALGFTPGGDTGYFHNYQLTRTKLDAEGTHVSLSSAGEETQLVFGKDYGFFGGASETDAEGPVVFVGSGSQAELEGLDLSGSWAFAFDSDLDRRKRQADLQARGALGLVVASPLEGESRYTESRLAAMARYAARGSLRIVEPDDSAPFPSLSVNAATAERILGASNAPAVGTMLEARLRDVRRLEGEAELIDLENVAGFWPGSDPDLRNQVVIVSAHYDHVGVSGEETYNGADDNGSGTCGLMAIAEALASYGPMKRSILLLWVSGEEKGLLGSAAWTKDPTLPEGFVPVANLNIDMIGRNAPDYLLITPTEERPEYNGLVRMAEALAPAEGFPELGNCDSYWNRSDHANFSRNLGIPVAFLFSDVHEDYHQPSDTWDKIDFDKIERVARLVVRMLDALQGGELGP